MDEETQSNVVWKGKGPIVYRFSIEKPMKPFENEATPPWRSYTLGDAWKYRLSITGAPGQFENSVPEIFYVADTIPGIIRDMASYVDKGRNLKDRQFLNLPLISLDNIEVIDDTKAFHGIDIGTIFANAPRISNTPPPPGEPAYIIEIAKNDAEPQDKQYNVSVIYADGYLNLTDLEERKPSLREGIDKFSGISVAQVPMVMARYMLTTAQHNIIRPNPANIKIINYTDNPAFTLQQISAAIYAAAPPQQPQMSAQMPMGMMPGTYSQTMGMRPAYPSARQYPPMMQYPPAKPTEAQQAKATPTVDEKEQEEEKDEEPVATEKPQSKKPQQKRKRASHKKSKWFSLHEPKYDFNSVIGMDYAKKFFKDNIILGLKRPDLFAKYKKSIHDGFLLYGPPGIGKTYLIGALAKEAKMKLLVVRIHQLLDMYLGNTEKNIHKVFEQARKNAPCIILFDEIDGLGVSRSVSRESGNASSALALNQLLMEMDGLESDNENVVVMGTTNSPQDIDTALLRSGRFTNMLYMRPPDKEDRSKLFEFYTEGIPKEKLDYDKLGEESNNLSPADIHAAVKAAVTPLIAEAAESSTIKKITTDDLLKAIRSRRASGSTMIKWYEDMNKVLRKGGFSEEEKLLYSDMLKDVKKRVRAPARGRHEGRKAGKKNAEVAVVAQRMRA